MPSVSSVHVDYLLTDVAVGYPTPQFIADLVYPIKTVDKQSNKIAEVDPKREAYRFEDDKVGATARGRKVDFSTDNSRTYFSDRHSIEAEVGDDEARNADQAYQAVKDKTWFVLRKLKLNKEINLVAKLAADYTGSKTDTPTYKFDDYMSPGTVNSDPYGYITTQIQAVESAGLVRPNRMALDSITMQTIANHPDILDRVRFVNGVTQGGVYTGFDQIASALATIFLIDKVVYARDNFKNTAAETATPVMGRIWSDNIFLYQYQPVDIGTFTSGAQFVWANGESGAGQSGIEIRRARLTPLDRFEVIEGSLYYDLNTLSSNTGFLITNTLAGI